MVAPDGGVHGRALDADEELRQRVRQADIEKGAERPGAGREREAAEIDRQRGERQDAVEQDREEADQKDDDDLGQVAEAEPGHEERREGDLGHHLEGDGGRIEGPPHDAGEGRQEGQRHAREDGDGEPGQRLAAGDERVLPDPRPVEEELVEDPGGRRQDVARHAEAADDRLPEEKKADGEGERQPGLGEPGTGPGGDERAHSALRHREPGLAVVRHRPRGAHSRRRSS